MDYILNNPIIIAAIFALVLIAAIYFYLQNSELRRKTNELDKTNQDLNKAAMELNNALNQKNSEFDTLKHRCEESDRNFVNLNLQYQKCLSDNSSLSSQMSIGSEKIRLLEKNVADLQNNIRTLEVQNKDLSTQNETLIRNCQDISDRLTASLEEKLNLNTQKESLVTQNKVLEAKIESDRLLYQKIEETYNLSKQQLEEQLTALSEKFVKLGTEDLSKHSQSNLENIVKPLKEELDKFKQMVNENHARQEKRVGAFENELKTLHESSLNLTNQAQELTNALRSGVKTQGIWGELQLERVLESSGLEKGRDYEREVAVKPDSNDINHTGRPDAVVYLPDNHCIVIDAKCSLTAYTNFINSQDKTEKENFLKAHIASVKKHVYELKAKRYCEDYRKSLNCPSFVFMFVPLDGALYDALKTDSGLYDEAARNRIYLVSPSSLLPALRVVSNLWMMSEQTENIGELIRTAQDIWKKFSTIEDKMTAVLSTSDKQQKNLLELQNLLYAGRGNLKNKLANFNTAGTHYIKQDNVLTIEGNTMEMIPNEASDTLAVNDKS
ncbi:DNA recombination protein RmuC [Succinivibrio dextrinosolvens]|nr:DNA recombination protein RmuC [Succinivibrio dextrinosolvens]